MSWTKGEIAEDYVVRRLLARDWAIRRRNFRRKGLEIDLIASRGDRLICVEVKARSTYTLLHPAQVVGFGKIARLQEGMNLWLQTEAPAEDRNTEFWLCSVLLPTTRNKVEWSRLEN